MVRNRLKRVMTASLVAVLAASLTGCSSVVARVNNQNISRDEYVRQLEQTSGLDVLRTLILRQLVLERAKAEQVVPTAEQVKARFDEIKKEQFQDDETKFRQYLTESGQDDQTLMREIELELAIDGLRAKGLDTSDAKLQEFFTENRAKLFDKPERVSFRQIVVPSAEQAKQVIAEANTSQELFQALVTKYSMDEQSKADGGLVREIPLSTMTAPELKELVAALQKLQPNGVSQQPIKVNTMYVVVKLIQRHAAEKVDFATVRDAVKTRYVEVNGKRPEQVMAEAARDAQVVVMEPRLKEPLERMFSNSPDAQNPAQAPEAMNAPVEMAPPTRVDEPGPAPAGAPAPSTGP